MREILTKNIYGIEIEPSAIKVAAFSLYLALVDELDPKTLWIDPDYQLPFLICDPTNVYFPAEKQRKNLYLQDTIGEVDAASFSDINLVVGNPPFGTKNISASIQQYLKTHRLPSQQVLAFIRKAVEFAPEGDIALIFNTKSLTNTGEPYMRFRKWLFKDNYVEKIYNFSIFRNVQETYGGRLFDQTNVPISIVFFRAKAVSLSDTIEYWAPKTYVKSNLVDGIVVDNTDIKHIPREECQKGDNKIWKIAMWGSAFDLNLINRLNKKFGSFNQFIKEGRSNKEIAASLIDYNAACKKAAFCINANVSDDIKKCVVLYMNSVFSLTL
ncbi:MAG: N-6 DNA methylase [Kiritimatiellia bacterium]